MERDMGDKKEEIAIAVENVCKVYKLYDKPSDRLKEALKLTRKKKYHEAHALSDVNFNVKQGECVGIIGTNGSGKSTILKIITGVLNPTSGNVTVNGRISALLELGAGFNMEYSGIENIYLNGTMNGFSEDEINARMQDILDFEFPYEKIRQTFNPQLGVSDVWEDIDFYGEKERIHPTQKPLKLISRLVLASSDEGDLVLDPFMGSGTTAVSCVENRRKYIGFEIDRDYYEKSLVRLGVKTNEPS